MRQIEREEKEASLRDRKRKKRHYETGRKKSH